MSAEDLIAEPIDEDEDLDAAETQAGLDAYAREYEQERSWEEIQEDATGSLVPLGRVEEQRARRSQFLSATASERIRRGMIRYVYIVVDLSRAADVADFRPTRLAVMSKVLQAFIREFFDQNPLSQIGLIVARNGVADRITELSGSPETHIAALKRNLDTGGDMSLQNALEAAHAPLSRVPRYGAREVLVLLAALSSCDPGDVLATIQACTKARIVCSVVGVAAEMFVCRRIAEATGGSYRVALDEAHLEHLVLMHSTPPPSLQTQTPASLVAMGFPRRLQSAGGGPGSLCGCHGELSVGPHYECPRCKIRVCDLPNVCPVCKLTLVSSPHLARSYHHLFPVPAFLEHIGGLGASEACCACQKPLADAARQDSTGSQELVLKCPKCFQIFCFECDAYIHESLHNCPGCEMQHGT